MPDEKEQWKPELSGKAKTAFNAAAPATPPTPAPEKVVEKPREAPSMVARTRPVPVPRPPGMSGQVIARQGHNQALAAEAATQGTKNKGLSFEDQQAVAKLNAKFKQAAIREQQQDRGR